MKVLLIGATGFVGQCVARKALSELPPSSVTLFVRNKSKLVELLGGLLQDAKARALCRSQSVLP
jgi:uncharacterized protein YbjT (DUF2867 family)